MSFEIGEEDRFIVLASDGVWEFISNEEVFDSSNNKMIKILFSSR